MFSVIHTKRRFRLPGRRALARPHRRDPVRREDGTGVAIGIRLVGGILLGTRVGKVRAMRAERQSRVGRLLRREGREQPGGGIRRARNPADAGPGGR